MPRWLLPSFVAFAVGAAPLFAQNAPREKPAQLQGRVVDSTGHPIKSATVETDDPPMLVVSNDSGFFRFASVPAGPIGIRVRRAGYVGVEFQLRLPPDSTVNFAVTLKTRP